VEIWVIAIVPLCREIFRIAALKKEYRARLRYIPLALIAAAIAGVLFLPLSWETTLPGVTVPQEEFLITAAESGFLSAKLDKKNRFVRKGEVLFTLTSHKMLMAQKRLDAELEHDETLLYLQNLDEKEFSGTRVTAEKVTSDRLALQELARRRKMLIHTAPANGYFVSGLPELSPGAYIQRTLPVGRIISKENKIFAYAAENQIGSLKTGSMAKVTFPDEMTSYPAKVTAMEKLPRNLQDSPLLQYYGGTIPYYPSPERSGSFQSQQPLDKIELHFTGKVPELLAGRSVEISVTNRTPLVKRLWEVAVGAFRREF
jgi:multidrug resistance efflux pump